MEPHDYAIIINLSKDTASMLNVCKAPNGIHLEGCKSQQELNPDNQTHGSISSRVFIVKATPNSSLDIVFKDKRKTINVPTDKEYVIVDI